MLRDGRPSCILMPTDLVHYVAQKNDGSWDTDVQAKIRDAAKIQLMTPLLTWIVHDTGLKQHSVFPAQSETRPPGPTNGWTAAVGTLEQWIAEQPASRASERAKVRGMKFVTRDSGLQMIEVSDMQMRVYVPQGRREALFKFHHESLNHLAAAKTYSAMARNYTWPSMKRDVRAWYEKCPVCELSNAARNASHGRWRAVRPGAPRLRYGMDYYGGPLATDTCSVSSTSTRVGSSSSTTLVAPRNLSHEWCANASYIVLERQPSCAATTRASSSGPR